jgi:chromosome segregation ATPase
VEPMTGPDDLPVTASDPSRLPRSARSGGRRLLGALGTLLLVSGAVTGVAVGWQQREVAAGWQARAVLLEQQRDDAIGRSEALSEQLGELANLVQLSVEDLATLEERLAELAGEKAQAEDRATLTREELRTLAERVESAVRQLNACVDDLFRLQSDTIDAYNSVARGTPVDVGPLNERLSAMQQRCTAARQAGEAAVALASRLR